jgi:hypothetical protein
LVRDAIPIFLSDPSDGGSDTGLLDADDADRSI